MDGSHANHFRPAKSTLSSEPILTGPNFDKQFILQTVASDHGTGATEPKTNILVL